MKNDDNMSIGLLTMGRYLFHRSEARVDIKHYRLAELECNFALGMATITPLHLYLTVFR